MLSGHLVLPADVHEQAVVMPPRRKRTPREMPIVIVPTRGGSVTPIAKGAVGRVYRCSAAGCTVAVRLRDDEPLPPLWTTTPCGQGRCSYRCPAHSGARA